MMIIQLTQIIKGEIEPYVAKKWLHRSLSLLIFLIWLVPIPALIDSFDANDVGYIIFFAICLIIAFALMFLVVQLWRSYDGVLSLWQKPAVLITVFAFSWGSLAIYAVLLARRPLDLLCIFYVAACLLSLASAIAIPQPNLSKSVAFFILFWLLFVFIQTSLSLRNPAAFDFYRIEPSSLDVVYIGNSHVDGVDSGIIDNILGINSYALAYQGIDMGGVFYAVSQALQNQHPNIIVVEAYPLRKNSVQGNDYNYALGSHYALRGIPFFESIPDLFPQALYLDALFPLLYYHSRWTLVDNSSFFNEIAKNFVYTAFDTFPSNIQRAFISQRQILPNTIIDYQLITSADQERYPLGSDSTDPVLDSNAGFLERLQDLCDKNNIRLILVDIPTLLVALQEIPANTSTSQVAAENNIPYFNYNNIYEEDYSRVHFWDFGHLNNLGSAVISLHVAELLSEQLEIPINEEVMQQYQNILVKNLQVDGQGNQITYTLNLVEGALSNAEFIWHVVDQNGNVFADIPYSNQNYVTFTLPVIGPYTITMGVRNQIHPELHFEVTLTERYNPEIDLQLQMNTATQQIIKFVVDS